MTTPRVYDATSAVEAVELARSGRKESYAPLEKIRVIEVDNFPSLGKLAALRFIEWVIKNPGGVVSLPTGKTPEHFIKWVLRLRERWDAKDTGALLEAHGIDARARPDLQSLSFVQIDEFYPMDARQENSFNWYVNEFYLQGFGIPAEKALLIDATALGAPPGARMQDVFPDGAVDLSLRVRPGRTELERLQKDAIERVDGFCMEYEARIREMGGIGFFLGGIGPDGHIAFNVRGSSFYSVTRLTDTNYETQAAAATDLGGIEISRCRRVITIGLATITYNPTATAIIIAAGDAKAAVVAAAVQEPASPAQPASVLQAMPNARFYLTKGAARCLSERRCEDFAAVAAPTERDIDEIVIERSLATGTPVGRLAAKDFEGDRRARHVLATTGATAAALADAAHNRLIGKIEKGLERLSQTTFLHTEPHHDDIMLGYLAHIYHLVRNHTNRHCFANLTSGFTAVSNRYCLALITNLRAHLDRGRLAPLLAAKYFNPKNIAGRMEDVYLYLDGVAAQNEEMRAEAEARRMLRNLVEVYRTADMTALGLRARELENYLIAQYPGAKDPPDVQTFKGTIREWEVELLWAYLGIEASASNALRLGFYTGDIFSEEPEVDRDVVPIFELIRRVRPNVVSVAFDPEGSGPDTHYKALQAVAEALRLYEKEAGGAGVRVWGYRNVWYRFTPAEADIMVPVSLNSLSVMHAAFMNCFGSQRAASFPSHEHDGPFCELAQKIQVEQYAMLKTCLGKDFFLRNAHPRLRAARGMIFLKEMHTAEFYEKVRELRQRTEARE